MKNLGVFKVIVPSCDGFLRMHENLERHLGRLWAALGLLQNCRKYYVLGSPWGIFTGMYENLERHFGRLWASS